MSDSVHAIDGPGRSADVCATEVDVDENCDVDDNCVGNPLPGNKFIDVPHVLEHICNSEQLCEAIPLGLKQNVFFVVDNTRNVDKRKEGHRSDYHDDCGAWKSSRAWPKTCYLVSESGTMKKMFMKNGQYCFEQQVNKKRIYTPLNPQPSYKTVLIVQRYYSTLKASQAYKKRVTWIEQSAAPYQPPSQRAVIEYCGTFPGLQPHGHAKTATDYVRIPATTMDLIGQKVKTQKPLTVYNELLLTNDIIDAPRNPQQIRSKKYHDKKKTSPTLTTSNNFADQMQQVIQMTETCETIQQII
jgi:hypothetical protein